MTGLLFFLMQCTPERPLETPAGPSARNAEHSAQAPPLIDRNLFFGDPQYAGAQLSPDGNYITFRKQHLGVMNIWIKSAEDEFEDARPLTADRERPVTSYFWSHDSRYILYVQDKGGDENYNIYRVDINEEPDMETGVPEAANLTPMENIRAGIYSVPRSYPDKMIVGINDRDPSLHDVYQLDIESGELVLLIENTENIAGWLTDMDANVRAGLRQTADGGTELLMIREDGLEQVYVVGPEESFSPLRYHKDGLHIYMSTDSGDRDLAEFVLFNPETRVSQVIDSDPEREVDFAGATFSEITQEILATYYVGDKRRTYFRNEGYEELFRDVQSQVGPGELSPTSRTHDEGKWLFYVGSDVDPGSIYFYDRSKKEARLLYQSRPDLPSEYLSEMVPFRFTARDGLEIPGYLTIPFGMEPSKLPVVVMPHGGPWARDYWGYNPYAQFLANRGYAVYQINFRGSTGFGKAFLNAGNGEWGTGAMQHDITDGVMALIDQGIADPDRIAIFGGSYGGYATLAGLAFTPDLYAAGISFVGPSNIITLLNSIPAYWGPIKKIFFTRVGNPDDPEDYARLVAQSPLFSAEKITAPLMVVQGANDPRVVQAESDQIVAAMRDLGRDVVYLVAEDEGHGFARLENRIAFTFAMEQFFAEHLGGRYQESIEDGFARRLEELTVDIHSVELPEESPELETAKTIRLHEFDGSRLDGLELRYEMVMNIQGNEMTMEALRKAVLKEEDGAAILELSEELVTPMGTMNDKVSVDPSNFSTNKRTMSQGTARIEMAFRPDGISGNIMAGPQQQDININLAAPVLGEGIHLDLYVSSLVIEGISTALIRYFDFTAQEVRFAKAVISERTDETGTGDGVREGDAEGRQDAVYHVVLEALDSKRLDRVYTVGTDGVILSINDRLPAQMGGGTVVMTLKQ